ncbi:MAG TPA: cytochrome P450 [Acidimicrobiia bacterium]
MTAVMFNPFEPGFFDDPYPQYAALRDQDPVHQSPIGAWLLTRYDDVLKVLRDPSLSVEDRNATPLPMTEHQAELLGDRSGGGRAILNLDPPDHDRLRRIVSKAFTPKVVEDLRPLAERLVAEALDRVAERGEMDVIADLAFPLPFTVISEMLGMPTERRVELRAWSHAVVKTLDPIITDEELVAAINAADAMTDYIREVIAWKRREPRDDLLTALLAAEDDGQVLDETELLDQVLLLYIAGHETTVNLIGNGTLALLRNRASFEMLEDDASLDQNAVEELLRYDSPVQFSRRIALEPLAIDGRTIEAGTFIMTGLAAANHDPAHWGPTADELDLRRAGAAQHVSFGSGVHHCLGAALARVEGRAVFGAIARRFPDLELVEEHPPWNGRIVLRGLDRLPVSFSARA